MRPRSQLWCSFDVLVESNTANGCRVKCRMCPWTGSGNTTRMRLHLMEAHGQSAEVPEEADAEESGSLSVVDSQSSVGSTVPAVDHAKQQALLNRRESYALLKRRRLDLTSYIDRTYSGSEQEAAARAQLLMVVMSGLSFNSQSHPATLNFYRKLRVDYKPQSPFQLQRGLKELEKSIRADLIETLQKEPHVNLTLDGWEDHQRCPTMGYTVVGSNMNVYLWKFERISEKQTADHLCSEIKAVVEELSSLNIRVVAAVADNASSIQKALQLAQDEFGVLRSNCFAHTLNLLLEDLGSMFKLQFEQLREVDGFFRNRHAPRVAFEAAVIKLAGTHLVQPGETRWGTNVDLATSVLKNHHVIDAALAELRNNRFQFKKAELAFLLMPDWWDSLDAMAKWMQPIRGCLNLLQDDKTTLGEAVELVLTTIAPSAVGLSDFAPGDVRRAQQFIDARLEMFLRPLACLSNLMDHRYRGRSLGCERRTSTLATLDKYCDLLKVPCPGLDDLAEFCAAKGRFSRIATLHCTPLTMWQVVFEGDPLATLGLLVTTLPCSQASSERVFSSADWLATDRERLGFAKLARQVFVRWNIRSRMGNSFPPPHSTNCCRAKREIVDLLCIR